MDKYQIFDFDKMRVLPFKDYNKDIVLSRNNGKAEANIPHRIKYHSPTGFGWGYGGSGPADLALNILSLFVSQDEAWRLHQKFKVDNIVKIPDEGGVITSAEVWAWLKLNQT